MRISDRIVRAAAATLPPPIRSRYREEWLADLAGADELGAPRGGIAAGALVLALRIDRDDPVVSGLSRGALALRRARWGIAFAGVGLLLAVAAMLSGVGLGRAVGAAGPLSAEAVAGAVLQVAIVVALGIGGLLLAIAVRTALPLPKALGLLVGILAVVVGGVAVGVLLIGSMMLLLFLPLLAGVAWAILVLAVPLPASERERRSGPRSALVALGMLPLIAAVAALGVLHITVWNPLAKLPGMSLDEIYAGLAVAGELPSPVFIGMWAGGAVLAGVGVLLFAALPIARFRAARSPRRVFVMGLAVIAGTALSVWVAGFGMGMGIADAFGTSGGDAASTGLVSILVGLLAGIPAVLLASVPGPRPTSVEAAPSR